MREEQQAAGLSAIPAFSISVSEDGDGQPVLGLDPDEWQHREDCEFTMREMGHALFARFGRELLTPEVLDAIRSRAAEELHRLVRIRNLERGVDGLWCSPAGDSLRRMRAQEDRIRALLPPERLLGKAGILDVIAREDGVIIRGGESEHISWDDADALHRLLTEALAGRPR